MRLSMNLKNDIPSNTSRKDQLICMKVQVNRSSELPLEYNQDQIL